MVAALTRSANSANCSLSGSPCRRGHNTGPHTTAEHSTQQLPARSPQARVRFARDVLGLGHYTPAPVPGSAHRFVFEFDEHSRRLLRLFPLLARFFQSAACDLLQQTV